MVTKRERRLSMLISDEEWEMLQALADRDGQTASDYIRLYIRRAHAELASAAKPSTKRRNKS
jgi:DNA-binding GntR family transcriptional regulator